MASTVSNGNDRSEEWQRPFQMATTVYETETGFGAICGVSLSVGSLLCNQRFFAGYSGFPLFSEANI